MKTKWIVTADSGGARIFNIEAKDKILEIQDLINPEGRQRAQDQESDRQGRTFDSGGQGHHALEPTMDAKEKAQLNFAARLAKTLQQSLNNYEFMSLIIISPPKFLGVLRDKLSPEVTARVEHFINKDVSNMSSEKILEMVNKKTALR